MQRVSSQKSPPKSSFRSHPKVICRYLEVHIDKCGEVRMCFDVFLGSFPGTENGIGKLKGFKGDGDG